MSAHAYTLRTVEVVDRQALSPSFVRIGFGGEAVTRMAMWGPDQRVKLFIPQRRNRPPPLPEQDWTIAWQKLAASERPARRSYTLRRLDRRAQRLEIDFVLHGDEGPASAWAARARPGDRIQIAAPNAAYTGAPVGFEWAPPTRARRSLAIGDATALPAIANIVRWSEHSGGALDLTCQVAVPVPGDAAAAEDAAEQITWQSQGRDGEGYEALLNALTAFAGRSSTNAERPVLVTAETAPEERVWSGAATGDAEVFIWAAGEAGFVKTARRLLFNEASIDRSAAALMGYWYRGRPFG